MKHELKTIIKTKPDIELIGGTHTDFQHVSSEECVIEWVFETLAGSSKITNEISIKSVIVYYEFSDDANMTQENICLEIMSENCTKDTSEKNIEDDIFPSYVEIDLDSQKAIVKF